MTVAECQALVRAGIPPQEAELVGAALHTLTRGWPVAVAFAAERMELGPASGPLSAPSIVRLVSKPFASLEWEGHVRERILDAQPEPARSVLHAGALLEPVTASLCDAVLEQTGSEAIIDKLVSEELLEPLANEPEWFELHPLLAEPLRRAAHRDEPLWSRSLHRAAGQWHLGRHDHRRALAAYLAMGDHLAAAGVLLNTASPPTPSLPGAERKLPPQLATLLDSLRDRQPHARPASGDALEAELSSREMEVLHLMARGLANKDIGRSLFVSLATVKAHAYNIFRKLGVGSRMAAVAQGRLRGLLA